MDKTIFIDGQAAVTLNKDNKLRFLQFQADDELSPILEEGSHERGRHQDQELAGVQQLIITVSSQRIQRRMGHFAVCRMTHTPLLYKSSNANKMQSKFTNTLICFW